MALRWNELDDADATNASILATGGWGVVCADGNDCTQDDGYNNMTADEGNEGNDETPMSRPESRQPDSWASESMPNFEGNDISGPGHISTSLFAECDDDSMEGVQGLTKRTVAKVDGLQGQTKRTWAVKAESTNGPDDGKRHSWPQQAHWFRKRLTDFGQHAFSATATDASESAATANSSESDTADASETERRQHAKPKDNWAEARFRPMPNVRERVRRVAVRAKELAATMSNSLRRKRRQPPAPRPRRSNMILLPGGHIRRAWDCIGLLLLVLLILVQVVNERWKEQHRGWIHFDAEQPYDVAVMKLQVLLDVFFIVDVFVNFRTAYLDENTGEYVKDAWRIASHYSRHWLICDLFCAIPLDLLLDETPHVVEGKGKTRLKWLLRRTGVLHLLRIAAATRPFRSARTVGKLIVHGRRVIRAFGGFSQTLRGVRNVQALLSFKTAMMGCALLQNMGVWLIFSNVSVAASAIAGSFAFFRLVVSSAIRGWEIRAAASYVLSLLRAPENQPLPDAQSPADKARARKGASKWQSRGRNPLASPARYVLPSAAKVNAGGAQGPDKRDLGEAAAARSLSWDEGGDGGDGSWHGTASRPTSVGPSSPGPTRHRLTPVDSSTRYLLGLDLAYLNPAQQLISLASPVEGGGWRWDGRVLWSGMTSRLSSLSARSTTVGESDSRDGGSPYHFPHLDADLFGVQRDEGAANEERELGSSNHAPHACEEHSPCQEHSPHPSLMYTTPRQMCVRDVHRIQSLACFGVRV